MTKLLNEIVKAFFNFISVYKSEFSVITTTSNQPVVTVICNATIQVLITINTNILNSYASILSLI